MRSVSRMRNTPFNGDAQRTATVEALLRDVPCDLAVETGTWIGNTTQWLARNLPRAVSIEKDEGCHGVAIMRLSHHTNLELLLGSSDNLLPSICEANASARLFAYLDAHDRPDVPPLLAELRVLSDHGNAVVLIDDFAVPSTNFGFGTYAGRPIDLSFIEPALPPGTAVYGPSYPAVDATVRGWALFGLGLASAPVSAFALAAKLPKLTA